MARHAADWRKHSRDFTHDVVFACDKEHYASQISLSFSVNLTQALFLFFFKSVSCDWPCIMSEKRKQKRLIKPVVCNGGERERERRKVVLLL